MASPTEAQVQAEIGNAIKLLEESRKWAQVNATNWVSKEDTFIQSVKGDGPLATALMGAVGEARNRFAGVLSRDMAYSIIAAGVALYVRHIINTPGITTPADGWQRLIERFNENTLRVTSRQFAFGTPTANGGNTGNGSLLRLTVDQFNQNMEAQHSDSKRAWCSKDGNTGTNRREEEFTFQGSAPGDPLQVSGSGITQKISALSANQSLLANPSFDLITGTNAAPTAINNWTDNVTVQASNCFFDPVNFYRDYFGVATSRSLGLLTTQIVSQKLSVRGTRLDYNTPYLLQVSWNRQVNAATGTLQISMGSQSASVVAAAQTGWQQLRVPVSLGNLNWARSFNQDQCAIQISWTQTGGTGVLVDDVMFVPGVLFDGSWYWLIGGSTPWLAHGHDGDFFTWNDTEVGAILQNWFYRCGLGYLPSTTGGGVTWAEP